MKKKRPSQADTSRIASQDFRQPSVGALIFVILIAVCAAAAGALLLWGIPDPAGTFSGAPMNAPPGPSFPRILNLGGGILLLLLAMILMWRMARPARRSPVAERPTPAFKDKAEDRVAAEARDTRLFVHLMTRLQREGRLLDFLAEDLDAYDDAQIGAAARGVHAGCRRVVEKLLSPRPIMTEGEEASVTLDEHYDASAVTLTGRVGDHPPFQGIVRHAGWRAARIDIPLLAKETDPTILAPAEVEVVGGGG
jgi:hypothetical protein